MYRCGKAGIFEKRFGTVCSAAGFITQKYDEIEIHLLAFIYAAGGSRNGGTLSAIRGVSPGAPSGTSGRCFGTDCR